MGLNKQQAIDHWQRGLDVLGAPHLAREDELDAAYHHFLQARIFFTREQWPAEWAQLTGNVGIVLSNRHRGDRRADVERAIACFRQALPFLAGQDHREERARLQLNLAQTLRRSPWPSPADNQAAALECYRAALGTYTQADRPQDWIDVQLALGGLWGESVAGDSSHNIEVAIDTYRKAIGFAREQVDEGNVQPQSLADLRVDLAIAYQARAVGDKNANLDVAVELLESAIDDQESPVCRANNRFILGVALAARAGRGTPVDRQKALEAFAAAEAGFTRRDYPDEWARVRYHLGSALDDFGRVQEAIPCYRDALDVLTYEEYPREATGVSDALGRALYAAGDPAAGIDVLEQGLAALGAQGGDADARRIAGNLGWMYFQAERWEEAESALQRAIEAGERLIGASFSPSGRRTEATLTARAFSLSSYALCKLGRPAEALVALERGKARLLAEALAVRDLDTRNLDAEQTAAVEHARARVRELSDRMMLERPTAHRSTDVLLADELRHATSALWDAYGAARPERPDIEEILAAVPASGALVAPVVTEKGAIAFVVPAGASTVEQNHILELPELDIAAVRSLIGPDRGSGWLAAYRDARLGEDDEDIDRWQAALERFIPLIWRMFVGPVAARLEANAVEEGADVLILPHAGLGLLPLHAAAETTDATDVAFGERWAVSYAPSATARRHAGSTPVIQEASVLVVADPTQDLPFAQSEGLAVLEMVGDAAVPPLFGPQATQTAVLEAVENRTHLHFACHGRYDFESVFDSRLILAAPTRDAGEDPLSLAEIVSLVDLTASRLVILSACETGIAEIEDAPEEQLGLASGFIEAGASGVISTLWAVSDVSTAVLMRRFYALLMGEGLHPAMALRKAQRWLRTSTAEELDLAAWWDTVAAGTEDAELAVQAAAEAANHRANSGSTPFDALFHWAPFIYSGA